MPIAWLMAGLALGLIAALPISRSLVRRAEARAREAERRARRSERLAELGSMTGGLAHEIKNPLSTVLLNGQLLREGITESGLPAEERERLARRLDSLLREIERLRGILTDFLQFAGRMQLDRRPTDLGRLVEELGDFFLAQCAQSGVVLRVDAPSSRVEANVDPSLVKQALLNLMINAVQAMGAAETGAPRELILRVDGDGAEARVQVIDTGPGIPAERREAIFHPYVSGRAGGTGLGLPTTRRIVEEHGGRIELVSEPGRGSAFTVVLPLDGDAA